MERTLKSVASLNFLRGQISGGDSFVFYTGTYECSDGKWRGELTSREHTPTTRPMAERVQHIKFSGTYNDAEAEADATVVVDKQRIRYDATLRFLAAGLIRLSQATAGR